MKHEANEQKVVVEYLRLRRLLFTATLGGVRLSIGQASQLKRQGYSKGVPDLLIFEPKGVYLGLFIELKRKKVKGQPKGKMSPEQEVWLSELSKRKYYACVCHGADEAIETIEKYMEVL